MNDLAATDMRQNTPSAYSKRERKLYYVNFIGFFLVLAWSALLFFSLQYLPALTLIGRSFTLCYLMFFTLSWWLAVSRGHTAVVGYTAAVGVYAVILIGSSYFNGHSFVFSSRGNLVGFCYLFLLFLGCMICARLRQYPRAPTSDWLMVAVGGVFLLLSLNFYKFVTSSISTVESREMIYEGMNAIGMGYLAGLMGSVFVALSIKLTHWLPRLLFGLCAFVMLLLLISVGARGAFLYFCITVMVLCLLTFRVSLAAISKLVPVIAVAGVGGAVLSFTKPEVITIRWNNLVERFMPVLDYISGYRDAGVEGATSGRLDLYLYYLEQFPSWWPQGLSGYSSQYPHNLFLEVGVRFGLLGIPILVVLFLVIKKVIIMARYRERIDPLDFAVIAVFVFVFQQSMTSMSLEMFRALWASMGYLLVLKVSRSSRNIRM